MSTPRPSFPDPSGPAPGEPAVPAGRPAPAGTDWEQPPDRVPLLRWRAAGTALLLVLVAAAAWWAVRWLTSPVPPSVGEAAASTPAAASASAGPASTDPTAPSSPDPAATAGGPPPETATAHAATDTAEPLRVHVVGQVRRPGVVELPPGARVADAVAAAGGATRQARTERINLAAPLTDGQQVLVPDAQTDLDADATAAGQAHTGPASAPHGTDTGPPASIPTGQGTAPTGATVDLNTADAPTLETLPGVGPATAEKIIAHRESVGPYTGLQDLDAVPGIGPATLDRLAEHVRW